MARTFTAASSERIIVSIGAVGSITGDMTFAAIARTASDGVRADMANFGSNTTNSWLLRRNADNTLAIGTNAGTSASSITLTAADGWAMVAATRAAGTSTPRFHKYVYSTGAASHEDASSTRGDPVTFTTSVTIGSRVNGSNFWNGDIAVLGAWAAVLTDAQVESLAFDLNAWFQVQPVGLWLLDQADTSMLVNDLTGNGADQSGITGTSVSSSSVPVFGYGHHIPVLSPVPVATTVTTTTSTVVVLTRTMHLGKHRMGVRTHGIRVPSIT